QRRVDFYYGTKPERLTSLVDHSNRTVYLNYTFAYSPRDDLGSITDTEGKTNTFIYDTNHQIVATQDALNRVVASNRFDGFGRVIEQYSQGDPNQTWRLFWSGFRNVEQDPAGGKRRFVYDEKRRLIQTQDALNHHTDLVY